MFWLIKKKREKRKQSVTAQFEDGTHDQNLTSPFWRVIHDAGKDATLILQLANSNWLKLTVSITCLSTDPELNAHLGFMSHAIPYN